MVSVDNWHDEPAKWRKQYQIITNSQKSTITEYRIRQHLFVTATPTTLTITSMLSAFSAQPMSASSDRRPSPTKGRAATLCPRIRMAPIISTLTPTCPHSTAAVLPAPLCASTLAHMHNMSQSTGLYQYWTTSQQWRNWTADPSIVPADAVSFWNGVQIGTVRYSAVHKQWLNVSPSPQSYIGGGAVWSGSRDSLVAGWTPLAPLYQMPETNKTSPAYNVEAWCYTTLEHVEWEVDGELVFTYVCNGHTLDAVLRNNSLYTPQLVRMPYPTVRQQQRGQ